MKNRYPAYTPVLHRAIELWYPEPAVTTPILKLVTELAQSRYGQCQNVFLCLFLKISISRWKQDI